VNKLYTPRLPIAVIPLEQLADRIRDLSRGVEVVAYCCGPYCVLSIQAVTILQAHGVQGTPGRIDAIGSRRSEPLQEWMMKRGTPAPLLQIRNRGLLAGPERG